VRPLRAVFVVIVAGILAEALTVVHMSPLKVVARPSSLRLRPSWQESSIFSALP
jgi:hypothetical protein